MKSRATVATPIRNVPTDQPSTQAPRKIAEARSKMLRGACPLSNWLTADHQAPAKPAKIAASTKPARYCLCTGSSIG